MSAAQHTPEYSRRGAQSGFWHCRCSCGWSYPGAFATTKRTVRDAHARHTTSKTDETFGLSPRAQSLLSEMNAAQAKCRELHEQRAALEARLMDAMADASEAQSAYYTCASVDEAQVKELARRAAKATGSEA